MANETPRLKNISWVAKAGYGSGNLGFGIIMQIIVSYLMFYANAVLEIPGSLVGLAISISVVWDAVTDPVMGYISDRTHFRRWGRRHLYLVVGTIAISAFNYLLWIIPPELPILIKFIWVMVDVIMVKTFMTIYVTPYTALGAELSSDYNERTSIQAIKTVFFVIGLMFSSAVVMFLFFKATPEFRIGQLNPVSYRNLGLTSSLLMLVFGFTCFLTTKQYIPYLPQYRSGSVASEKNVVNLFKNFLIALENKNFKLVVLGYLFANISTALIGSIGLNVFTYTFEMDNVGIGIIIGSLFVTSILSQPAWMAISKAIDKKPAALLASGIAIAGSLIFLVYVMFKDAVSGSPFYFLPFSIMVGFGSGALFTLPPSMVADTIDVEELSTGIRSEGVFYGCLTLGYKLSQSITIFFLGVLVDIIRFDSSLPAQPESTLNILGIILSLGSMLGFVLSFLSYRRYDLNQAKVDEIQAEIIRRREA